MPFARNNNHLRGGDAWFSNNNNHLRGGGDTLGDTFFVCNMLECFKKMPLLGILFERNKNFSY
jgi:hypothetical protein